MGQSNRPLAYLVGGAVALAILLAAGVPLAAYLPLLVALACPLAMVFMMRGMHGRANVQGGTPAAPADPPAEPVP